MTTQSGPAPRRGAAANTAWAVFAQLLGKLATLGWTVVATRVLPPSDFGAFAFALGLATLLVAVVEWGFDSALLQRAGKAPAQASELFSRAVVWQLLLAPLVFTAAAAATFPSRPSGAAKAVLVLLLVSIVFDNLSDSCRAVAAAVRDQRNVSIALSMQRWLTAALCIGALIVERSVVALAAAFLVATVLGSVLHLVAAARSGVRFRASAVTPAGLREYLRGTGVLGVNTVVLMVLFRVDAVILGVVRDDRDVAVYAAAYRLLDTVLFVVQSLRQTLVPVLAAAADRASVRRVFDTGLAFSAFIYLPFAAVSLVEAPRVLSVVFGPAYADASAAPLRWLALAPVLYATAMLSTAVLQGAGRNTAFLASSVAAMVVNLALDIALIPRWAGVGAAVATTVSFAVQAAVAIALLTTSRTTPRPVRVLPAAVIAATALATALWVLHLPLLVELAVGAVVYLGTWAAVMSRSELRSDLVAMLRRSRAVAL